ncbi:MAG: hypothetical protein NTW64_02550 [Candidatus Omnitrophica bacterium]|nr:hypothetical protein [Candidatus Omnitrophota bacterium]
MGFNKFTIKLQDALSIKLLEGSLKEGAKIIVDVDAQKSNLVFK